jgi:hypothetical protein
MGSPEELQRARVPDEVFRTFPLIARLLADMTDPNVSSRLALVSHERRAGVLKFDPFRAHLQGTVELIGRVENDVERRGRIRGMWKMARPAKWLNLALLGRMVGPFLRLVWRPFLRLVRRIVGWLPMAWLPGGLGKRLRALSGRRQELRETSRSKASEAFRLATLTRVAAWSLRLSVLIVACALAVEFPRWTRAWLPAQTAIERLWNILGFMPAPAERAAYFEANAVGLSVAIACYYYYQMIFAEVSFWGSGGGRYRRAAEVVSRIVPLVPLPLVLLGNTRYPDSWIAFLGAGYSVIGLNNLLVCKRHKSVREMIDPTLASSRGKVRASDRARAAATPEAAAETLLSSWAVSMLIFSLAIGVAAIALSTGNVQDRGAYAIGFTALNLITFGFLTSIRKGPEIQLGLARASIYGERAALKPQSNIEAESPRGVLSALR